MKLYQCSILILVFCLLLCSACSSNTGEETPTHSSQSVSATDTDVIPKGETADNGKVGQSENNQLIEDAYSGSYQTDNGIQHSYSIPKINLSSDSIDKLNEEIYQYFYTDRIGTNGYPSMSGTTYQWMQNDSLLTLIICDDAGYEYSEEYTVYCIDISEKRVLSTDEILQRAGMTHETFTTLAKEALGNTFTS